MTNQETDQIIVRGERRALLRYFLSSQINVSAIFLFGVPTLLALALGQFFMAGLLGLFVVSVAGASALIRFKTYQQGKRIEFWKGVRKHGLCGEPPTGATKLLIDRIIKIQMASAQRELLPPRQAIKLVVAYERRARQLQEVNARLAKLRELQRALDEKTGGLQTLGEEHPTGLRSLQQVRLDSAAMQKVADEIQGSCDRLDAILNAVQQTARAHQLHRELDQMSAPDQRSDAADEPAFEAESLEDIERQIRREIETYLQLERETEEHLR